MYGHDSHTSPQLTASLLEYDASPLNTRIMLSLLHILGKGLGRGYLAGYFFPQSLTINPTSFPNLHTAPRIDIFGFLIIEQLHLSPPADQAGFDDVTMQGASIGPDAGPENHIPVLVSLFPSRFSPLSPNYKTALDI